LGRKAIKPRVNDALSSRLFDNPSAEPRDIFILIPYLFNLSSLITVMSVLSPKIDDVRNTIEEYIQRLTNQLYTLNKQVSWRHENSHNLGRG
jgi:hypothetical protein